MRNAYYARFYVYMCAYLFLFQRDLVKRQLLLSCDCRRPFFTQRKTAKQWP